MTRRDVVDEDRLGATDILDRLARHRLRQKADEIARVTRRQRDADLAVLLHAADARTVAGARIDDDDGCLGRIELRVVGWDDADQGIVHGPFQRAPVAHHLRLEMENVRNLLGAVLQVGVAAFPQNIEEQDGALPGVQPIFLNRAEIRVHLHEPVPRVHTIELRQQAADRTSDGLVIGDRVAGSQPHFANIAGHDKFGFGRRHNLCRRIRRVRFRPASPALQGRR